MFSTILLGMAKQVWMVRADVIRCSSMNFFPGR